MQVRAEPKKQLITGELTEKWTAVGGGASTFGEYFGKYFICLVGESCAVKPAVFPGKKFLPASLSEVSYDCSSSHPERVSQYRNN